MKDLWRRILCLAGRLILSLRYNVTFKGLDTIKHSDRARLIIPNHPSLLEPAVVFTHLWPILHPRPMLYSGNFRHPMLRWLLESFEIVEVPFTREHSAEAREKAEKAVHQAIDGLREGKNHLMWPSGRIYRQPYERLGGTSALAEILNAAPDVEIIAVRTSGMWGSMWSYAFLGTNPNIPMCIKRGIQALISSLIFFMPRRSLTVTVEVIDRSSLPGLEKEEVNRFFESWYNLDGPEEAVYIPYHRIFGPRRYSFPALIDETVIDFDKVKAETKRAIAEILQEHLRRPLLPEHCRAETELEDLGLDSIERMEIGAIVEGRFGFRMDRVPLTFGQLAALADGMLQAENPKITNAPSLWFRENKDSGPLELPENTIHHAFIHYALRFRDSTAAADDTSGALTYERLLVTVLILACRIRLIPSEHIGILLPSSAACTAAFLAVHCAGRIPVMLNWTTGPGNLAHAAKLLELSHVVTSRRFIDRTGIKVENTSYLFLEDMKAGISKAEMVSTLLSVRFNSKGILKSIPEVSDNKTAVVLFTSGSEKSPKAVPLSHRNIISNVRSGMQYLEARKDDSLLSILPPFHSFGLTAAMLLPLLGGMRMVHHPDPTDASGLVAKIAAYRPTMLFCTPTFLHYILDRASVHDLQSLRTVVTGAEKCPQSVFDGLRAKAPGAVLYEGYGITECSPIVSMNSPSGIREGTIGRAVPDVEVRVVDYETMRQLPDGTMGMLIVSGPSVFSGYISPDGPPPFVEYEGKRWYVTGDLVRLDKEGYITFCGRLRRFLKAGGEMISLPALEEPVAAKFPPTKEGPQVAVEGLESEGKRKIMLFTTEEITLGEANSLLAECGMRGIMRIDEVMRLERIPVLGTGKTDYKVLRKLIEDSQSRDG
ncbi:MAG: AMP-binding protein [Vulcanimicrobiota bacterium]